MSTPFHWQNQAIRTRFVGEKCDCGRVIFPPRDFCPECGARIVPEGENLNTAVREGRLPPWSVIYCPGGKER